VFLDHGDNRGDGGFVEVCRAEGLCVDCDGRRGHGWSHSGGHEAAAVSACLGGGWLACFGLLCGPFLINYINYFVLFFNISFFWFFIYFWVDFMILFIIFGILS